MTETDAGIGVATQGGAKEKRDRTALPSGLATTASWDPEAAFKAGAMIGDEALRSGFNVILAGGANLLREPRNGRNFEYGGEDPLLTGTMVGAQVKGIQSNDIVSTLKHYALNDQETGRNTANAIISPDAARMSDLLAFEIALEKSDAGSVMCSYNLFAGAHSCENGYLLNEALKRDWGFKGFVMSDWGRRPFDGGLANAGSIRNPAARSTNRGTSRRRCATPSPKARCRRPGSTIWRAEFCVRCSRMGLSITRSRSSRSTMRPTRWRHGRTQKPARSC